MRVAVGGSNMSEDHPGQVTRLLAAARRGDAAAREQLWKRLHGELRRLAEAQLARESPGHRRDPTSLVHEAYLRLLGNERLELADRRHFFRVAARAMRLILIDDARKRARQRHGAGLARVPLSCDPAAELPDPLEALAVHQALERLERIDPRRAEIVLLRYFVGLTVDETAAALNVSRRTIASEWRFARAWLRRELAGGESTRVEPQVPGPTRPEAADS